MAFRIDIYPKKSEFCRIKASQFPARTGAKHLHIVGPQDTHRGENSVLNALPLIVEKVVNMAGEIDLGVCLCQLLQKARAPRLFEIVVVVRLMAFSQICRVVSEHEHPLAV